MKTIGVALYNNFKGSLESFLAFLHSLGVDYVEIGKEWIPQRGEARFMADLLDIYELKANLHVSYHYNLAESDKRRWKRNLLGVLGDLGVCHDLNIANAVLHCGWIDRDDTSSYSIEEGFDNFVEAYGVINDFANDFGVNVGLENQCSLGWQHNILSPSENLINGNLEGGEQYIFQNGEDAEKLRNLIGEKILFVLDVGHLGLYRANLEDMMKIMGDNLLGIHIHDFDQHGRDHLPLGTGKLQMDKLFSLMRNKDLFITLENRSVPHIKYSILHSPLAPLCHPINKLK